MKKFIILLMLLVAMPTASAHKYYRFNFDENLKVQYSALSGEWNIDNENDTTMYDFGTENVVFTPISGIWRAENGKYIQSEVGFSALTKSMLPKSYENFVLTFEAQPLSEENTLMIYFGSSSGACSAEINSYQSKLITKNGEFVGSGGFVKGEKHKIMLAAENGGIALYSNGELVLEKTELGSLKGKVGIGSWNSSIEFDNVSIETISSLGRGNKLIGSGQKAELVFEDISAEDMSFSVNAAAEDIQKGTIGIVARANGNADGYRFGADANGVYISKRENGTEKKLKRAEFKARSKKMYTLTATCDGDELTFLIDGKTAASVKDETFKEGMFGIFEKNTTVYCAEISASSIEKQAPQIISDGNTAYYIDSENGNDLNDGKSKKTAWKSLNRLKYCKFADGDKILLKGAFEGDINLDGLNADIVISSYDGDRAVISSCTNVITINSCKRVTLSSLELKLRHYATDKSSVLGAGYAIRLINSPDVHISDCMLSGPGEDTYTYAIETDSLLNEPVLENTECTAFGENSVSIKQKPTSSDTDNSHWAYKYMNLLVEKNIISEYRPEDKITRAELASMLVSALGLAESEYRGIFTDVSADMWYAKKIQTISDYRYLPLEMTVGQTAAATAPIKRAELAAMAVLVSGKALASGDISEECEPWMQSYIASAIDGGLMSVGEDGSFRPYADVTRAEACVVLIRLMEERGII